MNARTETKFALALAVIFASLYFLPLESPRFQAGLQEGLELTRWYAREHVILCLVPAFFIAGAIAVFVRQDSVTRYLGPKAPKPVAYGVASVSGGILSVCSCTVLPLFAGIWRMGAGLGPAIAFLYSGPAISALAVIMTARVLGFELGVARAVGAVAFAGVIGSIMAVLFRKEEASRAIKTAAATPEPDSAARPIWQTTSWIGLMVVLLITANWSTAESGGLFGWIGLYKWELTSLAGLGLAWLMVKWFGAAAWKVLAGVAVTLAAVLLAPGHVLVPFGAAALAIGVIAASTEGELRQWLEATWDFTKMIAPLLLAGVFVSGFLLGRPGEEGLVPAEWVQNAVGGESLRAVFFSALAGALMYFATLTEIPILQGLLGSGMGKGPALALLLAGPALSLPNMLALWKIMGGKKTLLYSALVVVMATLTGWIYGACF